MFLFCNKSHNRFLLSSHLFASPHHQGVNFVPDGHVHRIIGAAERIQRAFRSFVANRLIRILKVAAMAERKKANPKLRSAAAKLLVNRKLAASSALGSVAASRTGQYPRQQQDFSLAGGDDAHYPQLDSIDSASASDARKQHVVSLFREPGQLAFFFKWMSLARVQL